MIEYQVINRLIFQLKHMLWVFKRTIAMRLVEFETSEVKLESHEQNTYLGETMKSSQPKFYANASLYSTVLCRKHYNFYFILVFTLIPGETLTFSEIKFGHKNNPTP